MDSIDIVTRRRASQLATAETHLLLMLIAFAVTVIATRWFLAWTGYPKVGGGDLHIAHALWGGALLFVASLLPLVWVGRVVHQIAAPLSGAGMGLFIDEVGKFITTANDYFYPAAAPIIYATFLLSALLFIWVRRGSGGRNGGSDGRRPTPLDDRRWVRRADRIRDRLSGPRAQAATVIALFVAGLGSLVTLVLIALAVAFVIPPSDVPLLLLMFAHVAVDGIGGLLMLLGALALARGGIRGGVSIASAGLVITLGLGDLLAFYLRQFDSIAVVLFHAGLLVAIRTLPFHVAQSSGRDPRGRVTHSICS